MTTEWPGPLAPAALHGLAGEIVHVIGPHSEADPAALLLQLLAGFGNAVGRGPGFTVEGDFHATNLYVVIVGDSSAGRKGVSWGRVRQVLSPADPEWAAGRITAGLSTGEGLLWHVRDETIKRRKARSKEEKREADSDGYVSDAEDPGEPDKRLLIREGELSKALDAMRRDGNTLSATARELWDSGNCGTLTKNSPVRTTGALVSIIGHITTAELRRKLTDTDAASGFANRFLFVCARRSKTLPFGGSIDDAALAPLVAALRGAVEQARRCAEIGLDKEARELWAAVYPTLSAERAGLIGCVIARAPAQVRRLATIYALLDGRSLVAHEHLAAALAAWSYCEQSARYVFAGRLGHRLAERLRRLLRDAGDGGCSRTEIREAVGGRTPAGEIDEALENLAGLGLARCEHRPTGGRREEHWTAVTAESVEESGAKPAGGDVSSVSSTDDRPSIHGTASSRPSALDSREPLRRNGET